MVDGNGDDRGSRISRRGALEGLGALVGTATLGGCSSDDETKPNQPGTPTADELLAAIDTIVVVMMENRTFDHYFGALELVEKRAVDGLKGSESNLASDGTSVGVFPLEAFTTPDDPPHGWDASRAQFNGGKQDGFVTEYEKSGTTDRAAVMGNYTRTQLPVSYALADAYCLCNRWFASVMGPTWPNRYYLHCATSEGLNTNIPPPTGVTLRGVLSQLADAKIAAKYYSSNLPFAALYGAPFSPIADFFTEAQAGTLPAFCMVDPIFTVGDTVGNDDHPPADVREGQAFLAQIHAALAQSPQWDRCLFVITYDEHGGYFDHVPPPKTVDQRPEFEQLGFRVPTLVIGPKVKRGTVIDTQFEHVSVIATLTKKFKLEPLNARVSATNDLSSCIDPRFIDDPQPAISLPAVASDTERQMIWPGENFGGQQELADYVVSRGLLDPNAETLRAQRALVEHGLRLGAIRPITRR
jgi:phospholipase C